MQPSRSQGMEIQKITGLEPRHFADLVRASQLVFDPTGGVFGRRLHVDWSVFGLSPHIIDKIRGEVSIFFSSCTNGNYLGSINPRNS